MGLDFRCMSRPGLTREPTVAGAGSGAFVEVVVVVGFGVCGLTSTGAFGGSTGGTTGARVAANPPWVRARASSQRTGNLLEQEPEPVNTHIEERSAEV